ncbi:hypothetical protein SpCBS45565_g06791 [Spizellomyces sp. 'palustris']|nr:hypothetical protein SpCBS45565_g06791 [Spizellomyces sp. 'palustris']
MSHPTNISGSPPVRVKTLRNKPPDYLADSPLGLPFSVDCAPRNSTAERKSPLFTTLPASAFISTESRHSNGELVKALGDCDVSPAETRTSKVINLPTQWSNKDKSPSLELSATSLRVTYTGPGQTDAHAAAVRTNHPIPPQCGLFYYEVTIISKGRDGYIGVGLCAQNVPLNRLPGWEDNSWGYHGDDGHSFCCSGTGKAYGPIFTTGDIIGCVINFLNKTVSFTKNGVWLGVAFKNVVDHGKSDGALYPSVGLRTPGEIVEANFGQRKFKFDIEHHYKEEKARLWHSVNAAPLPSLPTADIPQDSSDSGMKGQRRDGSTDINELILAYLIHHGFCETAATFHGNAIVGRSSSSSTSGHISESNDRMMVDDDVFSKDDIRQRQMIRAQVLNGDMDEAINLIKSFYPSILPQNQHLDFQLRSQKFVEMIRALSGTPEARLDDGGNAMDVDDDDSAASGGASSSQLPADSMRDVVQFGQDLQKEFGSSESEEVRNALVETYSLVAYSEPATSPVAYLLDPSNRILVADAVNGAILVSQHRPAVPAIENIYRQTCVAVQELVKAGNGAAAFINVEKECLL